MSQNIEHKKLIAIFNIPVVEELFRTILISSGQKKIQ